jgi:hypothetical protein
MAHPSGGSGSRFYIKHAFEEVYQYNRSKWLSIQFNHWRENSS